MFEKLKSGLRRTKESLAQKITNVVSRAAAIDEDFYEALEEALLLSDVGAKTASDIISAFRDRYSKEKPKDMNEVNDLVRDVLVNILKSGETPELLEFGSGVNVVMVMGVNGSGKTTTIGKLAGYFKEKGVNVMLAACDTFRAAASEQLEIWANRNDVPIIRQHEGADPSAVMFDAVQAARARGINVLIADTAGRLHTQVNLMRELQKIRRVALEKANADSLRAWLVLDSTIGQNSLNQVRLFNEAVPVDGLVLTKLDGTARGGIVFSIVNEWKLPIIFIGVGEQRDDLFPFDAGEFAGALLGERFTS
ncbi:MAG TPA: signal recognition particle-docking protein FtsY [bacterium]|nr:signal recognition particle-docking protein FtsY [bacterium]